MNSFKAYFKKEMMEGIRSYRYLILAVVFLGFAILNPILLKMLPKMMEIQGDQGIDYSQIMKITQTTALQNYMSNLLQIGALVVVLSLMGIITEEVNNHLLVMPSTKKISFIGVVLSKALHYSLLILILIPTSMMLNYYYISMLFKEDVVTLQQTLKSAILLSCYFIFMIHLLICFGSIVKKTGITALITLVTLLALPLFNRINWINKISPYYFILRANEVSRSLDSSMGVPLTALVVYILILNGVAIYRLKVGEIDS